MDNEGVVCSARALRAPSTRQPQIYPLMEKPPK